MNKSFCANKIIPFFVALMSLTSCDQMLSDESLYPQPISKSVDFAVSQIEAITTAKEALATLDNKASRKATKSRNVSSVKNWVKTKTSDSVSATNSFYIINFEEGGFAVVSADKRATPIYAISNEGHFEENDNEGVALFMEAAEVYQKTEISGFLEINHPNLDDTLTFQHRPQTFEDSVRLCMTMPYGGTTCYRYKKNMETQPFYMLNTTWTQGSPYNKKCPIINGTQAPAGCVAIALGQIMAYHRQPTSFNSHTYYWNDILAFNNVYGFTEEELSVADLLSDIGKLVNMKYGETLSGTADEYCGGALSAMGYDFKPLCSFSNSNITNSLKNKKPVYISAMDANGGKGHAWVADGYYVTGYNIYYYEINTLKLMGKEVHTTDYLHFNWGLSRTEANGYYLYGVFVPEKYEECNFSRNTRVITDITYKQ